MVPYTGLSRVNSTPEVTEAAFVAEARDRGIKAPFVFTNSVVNRLNPSGNPSQYNFESLAMGERIDAMLRETRMRDALRQITDSGRKMYAGADFDVLTPHRRWDGTHLESYG